MLWSAFPYYLSIGMTADEYWRADPFLTRSYRKAWEIKKANANYMAWLQGLYVYDAVSAGLAAFGHSLNGGKGKKPDGYRPHPIPITDMEREEEHRRNVEFTKAWFAQGQK